LQQYEQGAVIFTVRLMKKQADGGSGKLKAMCKRAIRDRELVMFKKEFHTMNGGEAKSSNGREVVLNSRREVQKKSCSP
jgi:hypothetical protein